MLCISALVFRKINQMTAEHGPGLLQAVAGLSLSSFTFSTKTPHSKTRESKDRDCPPI